MNVKPLRPGHFRLRTLPGDQATAALCASDELSNTGTSWSMPVALMLIITVEPGSTTSTIFAPRAFTSLAQVTSARMPMEARNLRVERSTTTPFFGACESSTSCVATELVPSTSSRPVIMIVRTSPESLKLMDMAFLPSCASETLPECGDHQREIVLERLASGAILHRLQDAPRFGHLRLRGGGEQRHEALDPQLLAVRGLHLEHAVAEDVERAAARDLGEAAAVVVRRHHPDQHVRRLERQCIDAARTDEIRGVVPGRGVGERARVHVVDAVPERQQHADRKSTRLNSSHP